MGEEMYVLHDNGRKLFTSPHDCTPMQRFLYILAKDHHTDDPNKGSAKPGGFDKSQQFNQATEKF